MTKVAKKPQEPTTFIIQSHPRIKNKKRKAPYKPRSRNGVKMSKTTVEAKRPLKENSRNKSQTCVTHSKKLKKTRRPTISTCHYMLKKKWSQNKRKNRNKGRKQKKSRNQKRRNQNKRRIDPVPEKGPRGDVVTSHYPCS
ncbi:PREDICTED: spermatid nuclear transition protein 4-like [Myotis davidii]|uniref:spermatid nuclear transition protein 4-like n=1 Tax=Myotis davidii TaxID=225400 RepID=UPI0003EBFC7C|nr:PREDICTED: spermatid nuclear transition protein 4-like [Myotis davidii]